MMEVGVLLFADVAVLLANLGRICRARLNLLRRKDVSAS
jgi:hypothetical protein